MPDMPSYQELEQKLKSVRQERDNLALMLKATKSIPLSASFNESAQRIFDICKALIGATCGYVALKNEDSSLNEVLFLDDGGLPCTVDTNLPMPIRGLRADAYKLGEAVYENDFMSSDWVKLMPSGHVELKNVIFAPLNINKKTVGIIGLANKPSDFTPEDKKTAESFGDIASLALKQTRTHEALVESEERFRAAFMGSPTAMAISRQEDGYWVDFNQAALDLFGYTREETIGESALKTNFWVNLNDRKKIVEILNQCGEVNNQEVRLRRKDGKLIIASASVQTLMLKGTKHLLFITEDITKRKQAERELKLTTERFQKVFNSQLDAIFVLDNQSPPEVIEVNRAGSAMFGYEPSEMKGKTTDIFHVSKNHFLSFRTSLISPLETKGFLNDFEFSMKKKDGSIFPTEHMVVELLDDAGQRNGWISVVRDISDKKKLEVQIQQAQKMESIGNLAGGIAHDFNNILFPIIGLAEILTEDLPPNSPERENANEIMTAGKRGSELVKQILAFSRQNEHSLTPIRIQSVMKEVLKLSRASIPTNIEINQHLQQDCGLVLADSTQLHQIGMNLITNAYHAVEDISGKIDVEVREITIKDGLNDLALPPGGYAMLSVSDNGIGIDKTHLDKIFEPYFTTKEKGKGTGLGLSVVYGIVKEHKGDIKVMSELGKGTCFQVYLPLMKVSEVAESISGKADLETGTERILLVDDEAPIANLVKHLLERLGYSVSIRTSSIEALEVFKAHPDAYNLVITDMSMPHMTGEQLAKEMLTVRIDIPIIICTGFSERLTEDTAKAMGIKGFLLKPVIKSAMAKEVRRVLDEGKGER